MDYKKVENDIVVWLKNVLKESGQKGFVVGVSGGIDSAVVSALCAKTDFPTYCLTMGIHQPPDHRERAIEHIRSLEKSYPKVLACHLDLTRTFEFLRDDIYDGGDITVIDHELSMANTRSRLRMTTLYAFSGARSLLVAGTGNKVEDGGVRFCTKFGDHGVDISPIGDLMKTEVYELGRSLGISEAILKAKPTDGLWQDDRSDEDQIGATYPELEEAMRFCEAFWIHNIAEYESALKSGWLSDKLNDRVIRIYLSRHEKGAHKFEPTPVCYIMQRDK